MKVKLLNFKDENLSNIGLTIGALYEVHDEYLDFQGKRVVSIIDDDYDNNELYEGEFEEYVDAC